MAKLYRYKDDRLDQFLSNEMLIKIELLKYDIVFNKKEFFNFSNFVIDMFNTYNFIKYVVEENRTPLIQNVYATYEVDVGVMLVEGEGSFYFKNDTDRMIIDVFPGDFIKIPKDMPFCFKAVDPITTIKFYGV
jgi:cupin superfamily acireductone dioxygenase involved in methionine salvage